MPIYKGTNDISKLAKGTSVISKAYLGNVLVYNSDAVWMLRTYTGWYYSIDGIHYHLLESETNNYHNSAVCNDQQFIWNDYQFDGPGGSGPGSLWLYNIKELRKGNIVRNYRRDNKWAYDYNNILASDGQGVLVTNGVLDYDGGDAKAVHYSFDNGASWREKKIANNSNHYGKFIRYIGNGRFFFHVQPVGDDYENGYYNYWNKSNPDTFYATQYTLPDSSVPTGRRWCQSIYRCNDNKCYVTVSYPTEYTQLAQYRGTYTTASSQVVCSDIQAYKENNQKVLRYLDYFTYVYGKYYAILVSGYRSVGNRGGEAATNGVSRNLYVSTDGITFTKKENFFPSTVYQIQKTNGQLCVYGETFAGIMKKDETLSYTTLSGNQQSGGIVCNKFPKL